MRFPLTAQLLNEVSEFELRSACRHCFYERTDGSCVLEWPNHLQRRWPLESADGPSPEAKFCKEFELA